MARQAALLWASVSSSEKWGRHPGVWELGGQPSPLGSAAQAERRGSEGPALGPAAPRSGEGACSSLSGPERPGGGRAFTSGAHHPAPSPPSWQGAGGAGGAADGDVGSG